MNTSQAIPVTSSTAQSCDGFTTAPLSVSASGLTSALLEDIVARQLFESGVCDVSHLTRTTALSSKLLGDLLNIMRADARLEVRGPAADATALRYALTDVGRQFAREARERSGYLGPAPISLAAYHALIAQQSVHDLEVTQEATQDAYDDVIINPRLRDRLGTAMHSGKAIFIYGPAGTGKTFICSRLIRLLQTPVYIPHAVVVGDSIVRIFDPVVHKEIKITNAPSAYVADKPDPRLAFCERPFVCSGGELTADMLEIRHDLATRQYLAPLQLKATHGIYMIDDLGRQKMSIDELFNRWIVPMESGVDYLSMDSGQRLVVPFDVILIFSTNMLPEDLNDPAFQRRIGHKIGFDYADNDSYNRIWRQECERRGIPFEPDIVSYVISELHGGTNTPMLACHPRDLIGMALDYGRYAGKPDQITEEAVLLAWDNYFAVSQRPDQAV